MGSSWRYRHVAITPYSIGGFHGLPHTFFTGSHFASMDEPVNSHVGEKLQARIEVNRKTNQPNPTQVSPWALYPTRSHLLWLWLVCYFWLFFWHCEKTFQLSIGSLPPLLKYIHYKRLAFWIFTLHQSNTFVSSSLSQGNIFFLKSDLKWAFHTF